MAFCLILTLTLVVDSNTAALLLVLAEISNFSKDSERIRTNSLETKRVGSNGKIMVAADPAIGNRFCGTNYAVAIGAGRSATSEGLARDLGRTKFYSGCKKVGTMDVSCLFGSDHGCIATQAFDCPCAD